MSFKNLKNIFLLFIMILFQYTISLSETREVPNIIIKDNPKKEVYQIDTIKRRTKPAELNLTITKIKSKELKMKIDEDRKKIFADIEKIAGGEEIFVVENLKDMPNSLTVNGRKALNSLGRTGSSNLKYKYYQTRSLNNTDRVEIEYNTKPKNVYLGVLNDKKELKKLYKAKVATYDLPKNNSVTLKVWLFTEEMDKNMNLVFDPSMNSSGNFKLRANNEYSYPEKAIELQGLRSAFDMSGTPLDYEFEDSDIIEVQGSGIYGAKNSQGEFYRYRNKYTEFSISGFKVKGRIWSDYSGIELSMEKTSGARDGVVKFKILHKSSNGDLIQTVNVELYINTKKFKDYFYFGNYTRKEIASSNYLNRYVDVPIDVSVNGFISDSLDIEYENPHIIHKRFGETGDETTYTSYDQMYCNSTGFGLSGSNKIDATITTSYIFIDSNWYDDRWGTVQFFYSDGINMTYAKGKRKIPVRTELCLFDRYWNQSIEKIEGTIVGLPILGEVLSNKNINGYPTVQFKDNAKEFRLSQNIYTSSVEIYGNGALLSRTNLNDNLTLTVDNVKFGMRYGKSDESYDHYYLTIEKMELSDKDREITLDAYNNTSSSKVTIKRDIIKIPKFESEMLVNGLNSSIKKDIVIYEDVSSKFAGNHETKIINLGSVYFYQMNAQILRDNCESNPSIRIATKAYLKARTAVANDNIPVELTFNKNNINNKELEMNINRDPAGGNGGNVFMILNEDSYEKFLLNGGGVDYDLVTRYNEKICYIELIADKNPVSTSKVRYFNSELISSVVVKTRDVEPSVGKLKFLSDKPILKEKGVSILGGSAFYIDPPSGFNYDSGLVMSGDIERYQYNLGKHNVDIIDKSGKIIHGIIGNDGDGGYWHNLDINGENRVTLAYKKNNPSTFIYLEKWNYEKSSGEIIVRHYSKATENITQFYKLTIELPQLDPYTYYNDRYNLKTIGKGADIEKNLEYSKNKIELGYVSLENCNMDITIQTSGNKIDTEGMRIIKQIQELDIIDLKTGVSTGKKAKIKLVDNVGNEIIENKLVGPKKYAKVILEIPSTLSRLRDYEIRSGVGGNTLFNDSRNDYILKIGRNGYWKDIINKITLRGLKKLDGSATLKISDTYKENTEITFETIDYDTLNTSKLKDPVPTGVTLENRMGYGMLKGKSGDKAYIKYKGQTIEIGNLSASGTTAKKTIDLDSGNQIEVHYKNGEFVINLVKRKLGTQIDELISVCLDRGSEQVLEFNLTLLIEESWFKILDKDILDFGTVVAGSESLDAKASITIEASNSLNFENIKVKLNDSKIPMYPISNPGVKDLEANITYYELKKEAIKNRYRVDVEGKLDTKENSKLGEQKGIAEFIIEIKE